MRQRPLQDRLLIGASVAFFLLFSCQPNPKKEVGVANDTGKTQSHEGVRLVVLGTLQDAGSPQIGCEKACCRDLFEQPDLKRKVVSLGLVDNVHNKRYLFEATPDLPSQLHLLNQTAGDSPGNMPDGVFLTHAHIGHYTGLMYFGKEAVNAGKVPVYAMPKMADFLQTNGPWSQLVNQKNIRINALQADSSCVLTPSISVRPLQVPHRDEYSETVGFLINGPEKKALFIPDIDKWERWDREIKSVITGVDYAFLDATFFDGDEIDTRDMSEIPHPLVVESMSLFEGLPPSERQKIYFIHFNHTNPLLSPESTASKEVISKGFHVAAFGEVFDL